MIVRKTILFILLISPAYNAMSMNTTCQIIKSKSERHKDIDTMLKMSGLYGAFRPKNFEKELYVKVLSFLYSPSSIPKSLAYPFLQQSPAAPNEIATPEDKMEMQSPDGKVKVTIKAPGILHSNRVILEHNESRIQHTILCENLTIISSIHFDCHNSMVAINLARFDDINEPPARKRYSATVWDIKSGEYIIDNYYFSPFPWINTPIKFWFNQEGKIMFSHPQDNQNIPIKPEEKALVDTPNDHFFKKLTEPQLLLTHLLAQHYAAHGTASLKRIAKENECDATLLQKTFHTFADVPKSLLTRTYNVKDTVRNESRCKKLQEMCTIQ